MSKPVGGVSVSGEGSVSGINYAAMVQGPDGEGANSVHQSIVTESAAMATLEEVNTFQNAVKMNGPELEPLHCILCYSYLIGSDEWVVSVRPQDIHPESALFGRVAVAPVYVNGRMVTHGEQQLADGDFVRMGQCTFFQIKIPSPAPVPVPVPVGTNTNASTNQGSDNVAAYASAAGGGAGGGGGGSVSKTPTSVQFAQSPVPAPFSPQLPPIKPPATTTTTTTTNNNNNNNNADDNADPTSHDGMGTRANDNDGSTDGEAVKKKAKPLLFGRDLEEVTPLS